MSCPDSDPWRATKSCTHATKPNTSEEVTKWRNCFACQIPERWWTDATTPDARLKLSIPITRHDYITCPATVCCPEPEALDPGAKLYRNKQKPARYGDRKETSMNAQTRLIFDHVLTTVSNAKTKLKPMKCLSTDTAPHIISIALRHRLHRSVKELLLTFRYYQCQWQQVINTRPYEGVASSK